MISNDATTTTTTTTKKVTFDGTFVMTQMFLPALLDLFLCLDINAAVAEAIVSCVCSALGSGLNYQVNVPRTNSQSAECYIEDFNDTSIYHQISVPNPISPLGNGFQTYKGGGSYCYESGPTGVSDGIVAVAAVCTGVALFASFIFAFRRSEVWTTIVVSSACIIMEIEALLSMSIILSAQYLDSQAIYDVGSTTLYLQLGVLFSTVFAFASNLIHQGDAAALTEMGYLPRSPQRLIILGILQIAYLVATGLNVTGLITGLVVKQ